MHLGCSSWTWTGIWDDVRNPLSDVIPKRNLRWRHSDDFWRHPKFRFTFNYCIPGASQILKKVIHSNVYLKKALNSSREEFSYKFDILLVDYFANSDFFVRKYCSLSLHSVWILIFCDFDESNNGDPFVQV